jgi:hypothetical protein
MTEQMFKVQPGNNNEAIKKHIVDIVQSELLHDR